MQITTVVSIAIAVAGAALIAIWMPGRIRAAPEPKVRPAMAEDAP